MRQLFTLLLLISTIFSVTAQETISFSKTEILQKVKENNQQLKISEQNVKISQGELQQSSAIFLPNISVSHTAMATTNPLMAFGSKLNQEILTTADFNPSLLNNPQQIENFTTKIEVLQPLINLDGLYQRNAAKLKTTANKLQTQRTEEALILEANKIYMQLQLAYRTITVLEKAKNTALENKKIAMHNFEEGYLKQADVLAVEVRVLEVENQLNFAQNNVLNTSNYLSLLMNDTSGFIIKPSDSLTIEFNTNPNTTLSKNRTDIKAMRLTSDTYKQLYKSEKMTFLPRLNAFANYELHDDALFKTTANGYTFGAQLSWNLFEGNKRFGKLKSSKAHYKKSKIEFQSYLQKSQLELNKAVRNFEQTKSQLKLASLAMEQSKKAFEIRNNRFKEGLEKPSDLLNAETKYAQKQLDYYTAIFQHNYAIAYLQFLSNQH